MISVNQIEYQASGAGDSQEELILAHLQKNFDQWVAMPELASISGAYAVHSRIAGLRKLGCKIEHKNERKAGSRALMSFYRLTLSAPESQPQTLNPQS